MQRVAGRLIVPIAALLAGCLRGGFDSPAFTATDGVVPKPDRGAADRLAPSPFGAGTWQLGPSELIAELNSADNELEFFLTADGLTAYLVRGQMSSTASWDIFEAKRSTVTSPFGSPQPLAALNTPTSGESFAVTADGLTAFLATTRPGGLGGMDIWVGTRSSVAIPWTIDLFTRDPALNTVLDDHDPVPSPDGLRLYMAPVLGPDQQSLAMAERATQRSGFGAPRLLELPGAPFGIGDPTVSPDERVIVFCSAKLAGGIGSTDLWYIERRDRFSAFSAPQLVPGLNTASEDVEPYITFDGTELYFSSNRPGGKGQHDIYRVRIIRGP